MAVRTCVSRWYCHTFKPPTQSHRPHATFHDAFERRWVTPKLKKVELVTNRIGCLGHVIKPGHLEASTHTIDGICRLKIPSSITELRTFLVCVMYSRGSYRNLLALKHHLIAKCERTNHASTRNYPTTTSTRFIRYRRGLVHHSCSRFHDHREPIRRNPMCMTVKLSMLYFISNLMAMINPLATGQDF